MYDDTELRNVTMIYILFEHEISQSVFYVDPLCVLVTDTHTIFILNCHL